MTNSVRTRMAPSPTGEMHVGSMATLLKNYAFAKKNNGQFILRIEDTDKTREIEGGVEQILEVIKAYDLSWDEGPFVQSSRLDMYRQAADELVKNDNAYHCFCSRERLEKVRLERQKAKQPPKYDRKCRLISPEEAKNRVDQGDPFVIRLKVPDDQEITFSDLIRGDITFSSNDIDDQVLLKSDGYPTYHLAVVVDDHDMGITHIMRGEEWISSAPKHVLLYQAFGWDLPVFAHIPLFLNPDGKGKMSKRKGDVSAQSYLDKGYLPEAMLNFFMILGWSPKDQREIMTLEEYISEFDPSDLSPSNVAFDINKLQWLNGQYIRKLPTDELKTRLKAYIPSDFPMEMLDDVLPLIAERLVVLSDFDELTRYFYQDISAPEDTLLKRSDRQTVDGQLEQTIKELEALSDWSVESIETSIRKLQERNDWQRKQYFMMLRVAVTGETRTPPLFETMAVLGKERVLLRLAQAKS